MRRRTAVRTAAAFGSASVGRLPLGATPMRAAVRASTVAQCVCMRMLLSLICTRVYAHAAVCARTVSRRCGGPRSARATSSNPGAPPHSGVRATPLTREDEMHRYSREDRSGLEKSV
jgi:hypothetical protein